MNEPVKLNREEISQLEAANAEALEKEIAALGGHFEGGRWDYKSFWLHSDRIHDIFRRVTPLRKSDRARLWEVFSAAREVVRKKQDAGRRYSQWLMDKRREAVDGFIHETEEILAMPSKSDSDVEELLFLQDSLRMMAEEGWQGFPDTPDVAMASMRLDGKGGGREMAEIKRAAARSRKKSSQFLEKGASARLEQLSREISELTEKRSAMTAARFKNRLREIRSGIQSPILLREQKELLRKLADQVQEGSGTSSENEGSAGDADQSAEIRKEKAAGVPQEKPRGKKAPGHKKRLEVEALLGELELSVSRKKD